MPATIQKIHQRSDSGTEHVLSRYYHQTDVDVETNAS